jgi:rhamnulokinase
MTATPAATSRALALAAVDLGASSGRVLLGRVGGDDAFEAVEVHRFPNTPVLAQQTLHWDVLALHQGILDGLRAAARQAGQLDGVGIDSWGIDYGLLDATGALLGNPVHYRDARTEGVLDKILREVPAAEIYAATGQQFLPFNTLCQLVAARGTPQLEAAARLLQLPDLFAWWLTGVQGAEITNASTTQLLDVTTRTWATGLIRRLGLDPGLFPPLREPGDPAGELLPSVLEAAGLAGQGPVPVTAVGSHDTASAVAGVPAEGERFAYVSCGTWALVGVELDRPVLTDESRQANFTNELGVDGTIRYLRNTMGLWLLQESLRSWSAAGQPAGLGTLLREAAGLPAFRAVIEVDDPVFVPPGDLPARIAAACQRTGQPVPQTPAETVRCVLDSLALAFRRTLHDAQRLSGRDADVVHLVGGGARNELLCQLVADVCELPVVAGPVEATALGNLLVQARAHSAAPPDLPGLRSLLRRTQPLRTYHPRKPANPTAEIPP